MRTNVAAALLLSVGFSSFVAACSDGDAPPDNLGVKTYPVIGNAVLGKGVVMLTRQSDQKQFCSAVVISRYAMLTSARCLHQFLASQTSVDDPKHYNPDGGVNEYVINSEIVVVRDGVAQKLCVSGGTTFEGRCQGKGKRIITYRENPLASGDSGNDLALLYSPGYGFYALDPDNGDYADIFMGELPVGRNLEITGHGWTQDGPASFYPYRASLPLQQVTSSSLLLWASPSARPCAGDQGSPYTLPGTGEVVGLHSYNDTSGANGCAATGYVRGTRLRDKMGWIEGIIGKCQTGLNANGEPVKRCYISTTKDDECHGAPHSTPDSARWAGCRGTGCGVCSEQVDQAQYPRYFENHRLCERNTTCGGQYFTCSVNCPKPSAIDQALWGLGLKGTYRTYDGTPAPLTGPGYGRFDKTVNFNWGNASPISSMPADKFNVAWRGWLKVPTTGTYTFQTYTDDGVTLDVNGVRRITAWVNQAPTNRTSSAFTLTAGPVPIAMDYFDSGGGAVAQLKWKTPGSNAFVAIPAANLSPPGFDEQFMRIDEQQ